MKKIPTIFERDWSVKGNPLTTKPNPVCAWVFRGEGVATRKYDGTSCLVENGKLWRRRELQKNDPVPASFRVVDRSDETGKTVGWIPVGDGPEDRYHREAFVGDEPDGTYELLGPKVQGNPEGSKTHYLMAHAAAESYEDAPRTFDVLKAWLAGRDIEGLVWHHPDGRMAKIKLRDFGLKRPK